jgi:hypothetical protein
MNLTHYSPAEHQAEPADGWVYHSGIVLFSASDFTGQTFHVYAHANEPLPSWIKLRPQYAGGPVQSSNDPLIFSGTITHNDEAVAFVEQQPFKEVVRLLCKWLDEHIATGSYQFLKPCYWDGIRYLLGQAPFDQKFEVTFEGVSVTIYEPKVGRHIPEPAQDRPAIRPFNAFRPESFDPFG